MNEEKLRRAFEGLHPSSGEWDWSDTNFPCAFDSDGWPAYFGVKWQGFKSGHALGVKAERGRLAKELRQTAAFYEDADGSNGNDTAIAYAFLSQAEKIDKESSDG